MTRQTFSPVRTCVVPHGNKVTVETRRKKVYLIPIKSSRMVLARIHGYSRNLYHLHRIIQTTAIVKVT